MAVDFPPYPFNNRQDSEQFGFEQEDTGMRTEMEGGYVLTRPRHLRTPRRTWKTGFTNLSDWEKGVIETFYNTYGTYKSFTYTLPTTTTVVTVRFKQPMKYDYKGFGKNLRWNITDVYLEEV